MLIKFRRRSCSFILACLFLLTVSDLIYLSCYVSHYSFLLPTMGNFPSLPSTCANLHQPVTCNFPLYANATSLRNDQKLAPDNDITGRSVWSSLAVSISCFESMQLIPRQITRAFIATAVLSLIMAFLLLTDDGHYYYLKYISKKDETVR